MGGELHVWERLDAESHYIWSSFLPSTSINPWQQPISFQSGLSGYVARKQRGTIGSASG